MMSKISSPIVKVPLCFSCPESLKASLKADILHPPSKKVDNLSYNRFNSNTYGHGSQRFCGLFRSQKMGAEGLKFSSMCKIVAGQQKIRYSMPVAGEFDYRL
jgi:hypothetical protein